MTWRSSKTAPKDGSLILGCCEWETPPVMVILYWNKVWRVKWDESEFEGGFELTHWQPLPLPPTLEQLPK